jgi:hypothetical protein
MNKLQWDLLARFAFFAFLLGPIVISGATKLFVPIPLTVTAPLDISAAVFIVVAFRRPWFCEEPQPTTPESGIVPFGLEDKDGL